jgi:hypothetical protein
MSDLNLAGINDPYQGIASAMAKFWGECGLNCWG